MDRPTSFTRFPHLPPELQDTIWAMVLESSTPAVQYASLQRVRCGLITRRPLCLWRGLPPDFTTTTTHKHKLAPWTVTDSLSQTCLRSRAVVIRNRQRRPPSHNLELMPCEMKVPDPRGGRIGLGLGQQSRSDTFATIRLPRSSMDSSCDLAILGEGWNFSELLYYRLSPTPSIRRFAVQWCAETSDGPKKLPTASCLLVLLDTMPDLEVLYAVLEPAQVEAAEGDWPGYRPGTDADVEMYLEDHYGRAGGHGLFHGMGRVYFEIPPKRVAALGGLVDFVRIFRTLRQRRERRLAHDDSVPFKKDPVGLRFMTWRTEESQHTAPA
ncbi:hypothetical protein MGN70_008285 [Eutypa lata]|nr:hypothetical protein MGN70_008285 [Eutypa lata]